MVGKELEGVHERPFDSAIVADGKMRVGNQGLKGVYKLRLVDHSQ